MCNLTALIRGLICGVALFVCVSPGLSYAQMDPADPWQRDRAAHQENMDAQAKAYQERWPEYHKERYAVDAVGVIDKKGARAEFDKEHAPVDLQADEGAESDSADQDDIDTDLSEYSE